MESLKKLSQKIKKAKEAYYNSQPIISDEEYDALIDELRQKDPTNPLLSEIGEKPPEDSRLKKVKHTIPMGSLNKVNETEEFERWAGKHQVEYEKKLLFSLQMKLDGISVEIVYKGGVLVQAITRGDGIEGEDITHNVQLMRIPKRLTTDEDLNLRGEILLSKGDFKRYFSEGGYANPRNTVAGLSRRKDPDPRVKYMDILFFDVAGKEFESEKEKMEFLSRRLKLATSEYKRCGIDNAKQWYDYYVENRETFPFEMDGLVLKIDDIEFQESLGVQSNRPKGQIAWKFASEMRETEVIDVKWEVGRTGRITPVAHLKPVGIGGVEIRKATLHNASNVKRLGIVSGTVVLVKRAGDVIPQIHDSVSLGGEPKVPDKCPVCNEPTSFEGEYLLCNWEHCPARTIGDIEKWIKVLEIEEAGTEFVRDVLGELVSDPADLYMLTVEDLCALPGYKKRKSTKIIKNIQAKKEIPLARFLSALNIPNVSISTFETLVDAGYISLEKIQSIEDPGKLASIPGIGEITAEAIVDGLRAKERLVSRLIENGVSAIEKVQGKLSGSSFCFTGTLQIRRGDAAKLVEQMGGIVKSSVSKGLSYLVQSNPNSMSGKSKKARDYGTKIIGEEEFLKLVEFSMEKLV